MIETFASEQTAALFHGLNVRQFSGQWARTARQKLAAINAAKSIDDLLVPPGNHLETLKNDRQGQWGIRINKQWRVCFRFADSNANDAEIVDYH